MLSLVTIVIDAVLFSGIINLSGTYFVIGDKVSFTNNLNAKRESVNIGII